MIWKPLYHDVSFWRWISRLGTMSPFRHIMLHSDTAQRIKTQVCMIQIFKVVFGSVLSPNEKKHLLVTLIKPLYFVRLHSRHVFIGVNTQCLSKLCLPSQRWKFTLNYRSSADLACVNAFSRAVTTKAIDKFARELISSTKLARYMLITL